MFQTNSGWTMLDGLHAGVVQRVGVALVVLDGVGVGVDDEGAADELARRGGGSLQQVVVVGIDARYHVLAQRVAQPVHHGHLFALGQRAAAGQHHLEVVFVVGKLAEDVAPEGHVVVALHVGHDFLACLLGAQAVGCLHIHRRQIVRELPSHL